MHRCRGRQLPCPDEACEEGWFTGTMCEAFAARIFSEGRYADFDWFGEKQKKRRNKRYGNKTDKREKLGMTRMETSPCPYGGICSNGRTTGVLLWGKDGYGWVCECINR